MAVSPIKDHLGGVYKDMAEIISVESVFLIYEHFKGQQVTFPTKLMSKDYATQRIIDEYDGKNIKALAKKHGYSERWVRKVIKNNLSEKEG